MNKVQRHSKRVFIGVVGGSVVLIGAVLIPYPGPGWLIVFAGFAILATEFEFAQKALEWLQAKYEKWVSWLNRQHLAVRLSVIGFSGLVILATIWLLNTFGLVNSLFRLHQDWLISPFFR